MEDDANVVVGLEPVGGVTLVTAGAAGGRGAGGRVDFEDGGDVEVIGEVEDASYLEIDEKGGNHGLHCLRPMYVDLIGAGAGELCTIHGDSLVWHMLYLDERMRGGWGMRPFVPFQVLPVLYLIERYLERFRLLGGKMRVVFFDEDANRLWNHDPRARFVRELVRCHLIENSRRTLVPVDCLSSWQSAEWTAYLRYHVPAFILLAYDLTSDRLTQFLASSLGLPLAQHIVFMDGIEVRGGRLFGFLVSPVKAEVGDLIEKTAKRSASRKPGSMASKTPGLPLETATSQTDDLTWVISSAIVRQNRDLISARMGKTVLIAAFASKLLSVSQQSKLASHAALAKPLKGEEVFVDALAVEGSLLLSNRNAVPLDDPQLSNLFRMDMRMARRIVMTAMQNGFEVGNGAQIGLPEDMLKSLASEWESVCRMTSIEEPLYPLFAGIPKRPVFAPPASTGDEKPIRFLKCGGVVATEVLKGMVPLAEVGLDEEILTEREKKILVAWEDDMADQTLKSLQVKLSGVRSEEKLTWKEQKDNQKYELKAEQKYAAFMEKYSRRIHGMDRDFVVVESKKELEERKKAERDSKNRVVQKQGGKKVKVSKAEQIRLENTRTRKKEQEDRERSTQETELKRTRKARQVADFLEYRRKNLLPEVMISALIKLIATMCDEVFNKNSKEWEDSRIADEMRRLLWEYSSLESSMKPPIRKKIVAMLDELKDLFEDATGPYASLINLHETLLHAIHGSSAETNRSAEYQLGRMGPGMERSTGAQKDGRVVGFEPDAWQRDLLDVVDNNGSALVVAPTSSGKTFVSFYAMKRVLRESDDGVLAFVCPTNALANQVSADIRARYRKNYSKGGHTMWGIYTDQYKQNVDGCQILVVVPERLERLLMDPEKTDWARKIRYVVFDEVHSIGGDQGAIWEHLLVMLQCPIIALSATISNAQDFIDWLRRIHPDAKLIQYPDRYNDLRKHAIYDETQEEISKRQELESDDEDDIVFESEAETAKRERSLEVLPAVTRVHPCAWLTVDDLALRGFPSDFMMEPLDALELYQALKNASAVKFGDDQEDGRIKELAPEKYFGGESVCQFITRARAKAFAEEVKGLMLSFVRSPDVRMQEAAGIALEAIRTLALERMWDALPRNHLARVLRRLNSAGFLPAIVFGFERHALENWVKEIVSELESLQRKKEAGMQRELRQQEKAFERALKDQKRTRDKEVTRKDEEEKRDLTEAVIAAPLEVDPEFSFAGLPRGDFDLDEVILQTLRKRHYRRELLFYRAIRRGVGLHHRGMPKKQRELVETLFRVGFLRVLVATDTLAMGVNLPAKSAVFAMDSVTLNTLNFRHMAGRAGRRGYDQLGHVIFVGLPSSKVRRLLIAPVPSITGNFPATIATLLRSCILYDRAKPEYKKSICSAIVRLYEEPLFLLNQRHLTSQMRMYFRFSMEFLRRIGLMAADGSINPLGALAVRLYTEEPSNFVFIALRKLFESFSGTDPSERDKTDLLRILANLFRRRPVHRSHGRHEHSVGQIRLEEIVSAREVRAAQRAVEIKQDVAKSELDRIFLLKEVRDSIVEMNKGSLDLFISYVRLVSERLQSESGLAERLPFSRADIPVCPPGKELPESTLMGALSGVHPFAIARSPFLQMLGFDDKFTSVNDVIDGVRDDLFIDSAIVPSLAYFGDDAVATNRYILDFWENGSLTDLQDDNGLRGVFAWQSVKDFNDLLENLRTLVDGIVEDCKTHPLSGFSELLHVVQSEFHVKFEDVQKRMED